MVYRGDKIYYCSLKLFPVFLLFYIILFIVIRDVFRDIQGMFYVLMIMFGLCLLMSTICCFDIVRGVKISEKIEKKATKIILEEKREIFFTGVSAGGVAYATSLGIEFYNSKTILLGVLRKNRKKDFYIPWEEITKAKITLKSCVRIGLKDGTNKFIDIDGNKEAAKKLEEIIMSKIKERS